jgi:hypothetical protein
LKKTQHNFDVVHEILADAVFTAESLADALIIEQVVKITPLGLVCFSEILYFVQFVQDLLIRPQDKPK